MTQDELKQAVARAARDYVADRLPVGAILGVGTGSTANFFIDEIAAIKGRIGGTVASSEATAKRLQGHGIRVLDLNDVDAMGIYVDGADEIDPRHGDGQGRRRRADARKDRRRGGRNLRLHLRCLEAGGGDGPLSPAGRGDPDGTRPRRRASWRNSAARLNCARASSPTTAT
jgi:hypothetical protein